MRAKKAAVVREAAEGAREHGLTEDDLMGAIRDEFAGNATQLAAGRAERDPFIPRGPGIPPAAAPAMAANDGRFVDNSAAAIMYKAVAGTSLIS